MTTSSMTASAMSTVTCDARELAWCYGGLEGEQLIRALHKGPLGGKVALVSSFGADSVVLLHMVSRVDRAFPVIFLDTLKHFPATLAYRDELVRRLGLTDVRSARPDALVLAKYDPDGMLNASDPDSCCDVRKTEPLERALQGFAGWITGRKRFQAATRTALETIEADPASSRLKINPLARWSSADVEAYRLRHGLPAHPLTAEGFRSIGCAPCTRPVSEGEDERAGRWAGRGKTECGIHLGARVAA